ncbi:uroporphyrinogen-III synthase [Pelistega sp. MC2]|uniref:uroporphyrinogen-III synthase n=1 Tax=Pelistega sp. MC2 TaxID=1720297 RepID=UPI0008D97D2E|nr:uroporphyrinogen-III synthase [Pelistega sp. MC2]
MISRSIILLSRSEAKNKLLASALSRQLPINKNVEILSVPALSLKCRQWTDLASEEQASIEQLADIDLVFCVSAFAAECFFSLLGEKGLVFPKQLYFACVGSATRDFLRQKGIAEQKIIYPQDGNDSESVWPLLEPYIPSSFSKILILRAATGREWLADKIREKGAIVHYVATYQRQENMLGAGIVEDLQKSMDNSAKIYWLLSSGEGVQALFHQLAPIFQNLTLAEIRNRHHFFVFHPRIAERLQQCLLEIMPYHLKQEDLLIDVVPVDNDLIAHHILEKLT